MTGGWLAAAGRGARKAAWLGACAWLVGFGPYRAGGLGANALGMADAVVASGSGATALYGNPAGMGSLKQQVVESGFVRDPQQGTSSLHVASVDSTSAWGLTGGIGYSNNTNWALEHPLRTGSDLRLGVSAGTASDAGRLQAGVSARRVDINYVNTGHHLSGWTGDAGVAAALGPLRLGAVYRNGVRLDAIEAPRRIATGVGLAADQFLIEGDASWNVDPGSGPIYRGGAAYQFGAEEGVQLRGGYIWDNGRPGHFNHMVTGGLSYRTPRMGIDVSTGVGLRQQDVLVAVGFVWLMPYDAN